MILIYDNTIRYKVEMVFVPLHFGRVCVFYHLRVQLPVMESNR
jgi:hypothetical protein